MQNVQEKRHKIKPSEILGLILETTAKKTINQAETVIPLLYDFSPIPPSKSPCKEISLNLFAQ